MLKRKGESPIETIDDIKTSKMLTVCFMQYFRAGCANLNTGSVKVYMCVSGGGGS